MNPIPLGYYSYADLVDGTIRIEHLIEINDHILMSRENEWRLREGK